MYVYIESKHNEYGALWTVGFYSPDGLWHPDSDHKTQTLAAERVHWLNGGDEPPEPENPYILHGEELERTIKSKGENERDNENERNN